MENIEGWVASHSLVFAAVKKVHTGSDLRTGYLELQLNVRIQVCCGMFGMLAGNFALLGN